MARIEDYALMGDCETAALVSLAGSVDWLSFPAFDSAACFAALLGTPDHGRWLLAPPAPVTSVRRWYHGDSLVLETEFTTPDGVVSVIDFMPVRNGWYSPHTSMHERRRSEASLLARAGCNESKTCGLAGTRMMV